MTLASAREAPTRHRQGVRRWGRLRLLAQVCWNLRLLGLFLVGPVFGVLLASAIFGMAPDLLWTAGIVFLLTSSMYALLVRSEWRRLVAEDGP